MNASRPDLLFVYGSLRGKSTHPMARALAAGADYLGQAWVQGILYRISWYPGLVPGDDPLRLVPGDLYCLHSPEKLLPLLDEYEECTPRFPEPHEYRRAVMMVRHDGQDRAAWAYIYNRPIEGLETLEDV